MSMSQGAQSGKTLEQFHVKMNSDFQNSGAAQAIPARKIEMVGEPNRPTTVSIVERSGATVLTKKGEITSAEINTFLETISDLRGLPTEDSASGEDVYGFGIVLSLTTDDIQWINGNESGGFGTEKSSAQPTAENKETFKKITDAIASLARKHAK